MLVFFDVFAWPANSKVEPIGRASDGACWPPTECSAIRRQLCWLALRADMALRLCNTCSLLAVLLAPSCAKGAWARPAWFWRLGRQGGG